MDQGACRAKPHILLSSETRGLGRLGDDLRDTTPEIGVARVTGSEPDLVLTDWSWRRTTIGRKTLG